MEQQWEGQEIDSIFTKSLFRRGKQGKSQIFPSFTIYLGLNLQNPVCQKTHKVVETQPFSKDYWAKIELRYWFKNRPLKLVKFLKLNISTHDVSAIKHKNNTKNYINIWKQKSNYEILIRSQIAIMYPANLQTIGIYSSRNDTRCKCRIL